MEENHELLKQVVIIRPYEEKDKDAIWDVSQKALQGVGIMQQKGPQHKDFDNIQEKFRDTGGIFLIGEIDGKIVAIGGYSYDGNGTAHVKRMRVLPEYQGTGVAQNLLDALEIDAQEKGYMEMVLGTTTLMPRAIAFYKKNGYQEVGRESVIQPPYPPFANITYHKFLPEKQKI
ncbi:GNAT family N-acetyltransferase [Candidatus Roizmanbacteria bacterium]|nr:GNAT family N-acetyltransferase [Candidatus Roizmanbacteria bacterium]